MLRNGCWIGELVSSTVFRPLADRSGFGCSLWEGHGRRVAAKTTQRFYCCVPVAQTHKNKQKPTNTSRISQVFAMLSRVTARAHHGCSSQPAQDGDGATPAKTACAGWQAMVEFAGEAPAAGAPDDGATTSTAELERKRLGQERREAERLAAHVSGAYGGGAVG